MPQCYIYGCLAAGCDAESETRSVPSGPQCGAQLYVCDPDEILSRSDQDAIEGYIKRSKNETAVAVIGKKRSDFVASAGADMQVAAGEFARELQVFLFMSFSYPLPC